MPCGGELELASSDGKVFTMDDVRGDGHCLYDTILLAINAMQRGVTSPERLLFEAQEIQRGDDEIQTITIGALGDLKLFAWKNQPRATPQYFKQRVGDDEIVLCLLSGKVSLTHHKYLAHFIHP